MKWQLFLLLASGFIATSPLNAAETNQPQRNYEVEANACNSMCGHLKYFCLRNARAAQAMAQAKADAANKSPRPIEGTRGRMNASERPQMKWLMDTTARPRTIRV